VPPGDWRYRRLYHEYFRAGWEKRVLGPHAQAVEETLVELASRGPLSSLDFEDQRRVDEWAGHWYGPKLVKQVLRALWDTGQIVTHHRENGRHVYSLPGEVIPREALCAEPASSQECVRFLILRRHQSAGLLRSTADRMLWSLPGTFYKPERLELISELVSEGALVPVEVEGDLYHARTQDLEWAQAPLPEPRMLFLAPLDSLLWDRKAVNRIYGFDYVWEVYKPESERRWGYYVLPVFYGDALVARVDARVENGAFKIERWWWEPGFEVTADAQEAFAIGARRFAHYLGAGEVRLGRKIQVAVRWQLADALKGTV
jgi:uncharacterized protein YcaQ